MRQSTPSNPGGLIIALEQATEGMSAGQVRQFTRLLQERLPGFLRKLADEVKGAGALELGGSIWSSLPPKNE